MTKKSHTFPSLSRDKQTLLHFVFKSQSVFFQLLGIDNNLICCFVDVEPPIIHNCPKSKIVYTDKGEDYITVSWSKPFVTDNSGENISMTLVDDNIDPFYAVGSYRIIYTAQDSAGNRAKACQFTISVRSKQ